MPETHLYASSANHMLIHMTLRFSRGASGMISVSSAQVMRTTVHGWIPSGSPTWVMFDSTSRQCYCIGEGTPHQAGGYLVICQLGDDGKPKSSKGFVIPFGALGGFIFSTFDKRGLILGHSRGSSMSIYETGAVDGQTQPGSLPTLTKRDHSIFSWPELGPESGPQNSPHPRNVVLDPSGTFVLLLDSEQDKIRLHAINQDTLRLAHLHDFVAISGSGPYEAVFWSSENSRHNPQRSDYLTIRGLDQTLATYKVGYRADGGVYLEFASLYSFFSEASVYMPTHMALSPDQNYIIVSVIHDAPPTRAAAGTSAQRSSGMLFTFKLDADGILMYHSSVSARCALPEHISLNNTGDLIAVVSPSERAVVILYRDPCNAKIRGEVARYDVGEGVTCVAWGDSSWVVEEPSGTHPVGGD